MTKLSKKAKGATASRASDQVSPSSLKAKAARAENEWAQAAVRELEYRVVGGAAKVLSEMPSSFEILETRYRANLYLLLSFVYEIAAYLRDDQRAWSAFVKDPVWNGTKNRPRSEDRLDALRSALRLAVGLHGDAASKLASKYHSALAEAFRQNIPPGDIGGYIEKGGGVERLASEEADRSRGIDHGGEPVQTFEFGENAKLIRTKTARRVKYAMEVVRGDFRETMTVERTLRKPSSRKRIT